MQKSHIFISVIAFLIGMGACYVLVGLPSAPKEKSLHIAAKESESEKKSSEKSKKNDDEEDDKDDEKNDEYELEGNYNDPATCDALTNAQTYSGKDEDFMFMIAGKESWVFRSRQDLQMNFDLSEQELALYVRLVEVLKSKGTDLILSYIPPRAMIATDYLPSANEITEDYDAESARENYNALIAKMNEKGVNMVGTPNPEIGAQYFNHADQHWTTQGAQNMAQAIGIFVNGLPVAQNLPSQVFKTTIGKEVSYDGRFGEFIKKVCGFRPQPEKDKEVKTDRADEQVSEAQLFNDQAAPSVVLIGTSNSIRDEFNSNFAGYLKEELSTDVYNAAISGGGMDDSLLSYLVSDMFRNNPPKLIIWELPGYYDLGGEGMEAAIRQGIASIAGDCDKPLATFPSTIVEGKKLDLFGNLETLNIGAEQSYVEIKFEEALAKDFSISIKTNDKENKNFKFKKRREGNSAAFYYMPKGGNSTLSSVALNVNKSIEGLKVEAKLCPLPTP